MSQKQSGGMKILSNMKYYAKRWRMIDLNLHKTNFAESYYSDEVMEILKDYCAWKNFYCLKSMAHIITIE